MRSDLRSSLEIKMVEKRPFVRSKTPFKITWEKTVKVRYLLMITVIK